MFLFMALIIIETRVDSKKCLFHFNASQIQLCCFFDSWQTIDFMRIIVFISHLGSHTERMEKWKRVGGGWEKKRAAGGFVCKATALAHCLCSVFWLRITHDLSLFITGSERHTLAARPLDGQPLRPAAPLLHTRNPWHAQDWNNWNTQTHQNDIFCYLDDFKSSTYCLAICGRQGRESGSRRGALPQWQICAFWLRTEKNFVFYDQVQNECFEELTERNLGRRSKAAGSRRGASRGRGDSCLRPSRKVCIADGVASGGGRPSERTISSSSSSTVAPGNSGRPLPIS